MDETICPECGRPNLAEAVKCWYCQKILESDSEKKIPEETPDAILKTNLQDFDDKERMGNQEGEVPDWLRRIRELKKADQELEDESERWQQEQLFSGKSGDIEQSQKKQKENENITPQKKIHKHPPRIAKEDSNPSLLEPKQSNALSDEGKINNLQTNHSVADSHEDLPEGFTPLLKDHE